MRVDDSALPRTVIPNAYHCHSERSEESPPFPQPRYVVPANAGIYSLNRDWKDYKD